MSLATRCPDCATTFRLSLEQSLAAQGWVRCGRCGSIFVAEPGDAEPAATPRVAQTVPAHAQPQVQPVQDLAIDVAPAAPSASASAQVAAPLPEPTLVASRSADGLPRFVWESELDARAPMSAGWRRTWWSLTLLSVLGAALQCLLLWRNDLASRWPAMQEPLRALCEPLGCRIEPPRRLGALRIENSELSQIAPTVYDLQVVVRNTAAQALMWPAVDLSLTDASNRLVARRVLQTAQFAVSEPAIGPGRETVLRARLSTGERAVSGYTVELFYP